MRKIALIKIHNYYYGNDTYENDLRILLQDSVDIAWTEIEEKDFDVLNKYLNIHRDYLLIEQNLDKKSSDNISVFDTVLQDAKKYFKQIEDMNKRNRLAAEKRKKTMEAKALERKKKQFEKLKKELDLK